MRCDPVLGVSVYDPVVCVACSGGWCARGVMPCAYAFCISVRVMCANMAYASRSGCLVLAHMYC